MQNMNKLFLCLILSTSFACSFNKSSSTSTSSPRVVTSNPKIPPATSPSVPAQVSESNIERFYVVHGRRYAIMKSSQGFSETGIASWYGNPFHGRKTSNGETYDMHAMTAAHKHLPLPTFVEVTNIQNNKSVVLRVNDRGPFVGDRVIDLSFAAAKALDIIQQGTGTVRVRALDDLNLAEDNDRLLQADQASFIQVASFTQHSNAFSYQERLIKNGIAGSRIIQVADDSGQTLLRVQIGPITSGQSYDEIVKKLKKIGITNTLLVSE